MKLLVSFSLLIFCFFSHCAMSNGNYCETHSSLCEMTPLGILALESNGVEGGYSYITLNGERIYIQKNSNMMSYMNFYWDNEFIRKNGNSFVTKAIISYSKKGACITEDGEPYNCNANIIIDLTGDKHLISNEFFSDTGDSYLSWVSWGKLNSVIVFEDDSKFKYSKGHVERVKNEKH